MDGVCGGQADCARTGGEPRCKRVDGETAAASRDEEVGAATALRRRFRASRRHILGARPWHNARHRRSKRPPAVPQFHKKRDRQRLPAGHREHRRTRIRSQRDCHRRQEGAVPRVLPVQDTDVPIPHVEHRPQILDATPEAVGRERIKGADAEAADRQPRSVLCRVCHMETHMEEHHRQAFASEGWPHPIHAPQAAHNDAQHRLFPAIPVHLPTGRMRRNAQHEQQDRGNLHRPKEADERARRHVGREPQAVRLRVFLGIGRKAKEKGSQRHIDTGCRL